MTTPPSGAGPSPGGEPQDPQPTYQPYQPQPYGQPYGYPAVYGPQAPTNGLSIASLVLSIVALPLMFCYGFGSLLGLVGAILGHVAMGQINRSNESGRGMALAGVIIGWLAVALGIAFVVLVFGLFFAVGTAGG